MERLVIIDHAAHQVYFEDVPAELLEKQYGGEEEKYIEDNYDFEGDYSWDFITSVKVIEEWGDVVEIELPTDKASESDKRRVKALRRLEVLDELLGEHYPTIGDADTIKSTIGEIRELLINTF